MNPLIQLKKATSVFFVALVCFGLLRTTQAVIPAPDGGYGPPAYGTGNTAEGQNALLSLTTGSYNTGVGLLSLRSNTTTSLNTAIGAGALLANTADQNTAAGAVALFHNTTGAFNTANGAFALFSNTTGNGNTATGDEALFNNTTGAANTANGSHVLVSNTTGGFNTATGFIALESNTTGSGNTAVGVEALGNNTTGSMNTALGDLAGLGVTTANNVICIGPNVGGRDVSNTCFIGNIRGVTTVNNDAIPVLIDSTNQLGTISSSRRFKKEIKPMDSASEAILALKPVTFHYKTDKTNRPEFGLIAEEVGAVNPDLVVRNKDGEIYTVRYDAVNAMLLNEFLKEHRKVEQQERKLGQQETTIAQLKSAVTKQEATAAEQRKEIAALTAGLQKVSAQVQAGRVTPQMIVSNQ